VTDLSNQSSADSFVGQINEHLLAIEETEKAKGELEKGKGQYCADALTHAIESGKLLILAKESVEAERGKKGNWGPWLQGRFGARLPLSTAGLYMKLAEGEEHLFGKMQEISDKRMSIRSAMKLIPLTAAGEKKRAKAQAKAAEKKAREEATARRDVVAGLSTEERVADLDLDEFLLAKGDVEVESIFLALTSTLDDDQLTDLKDRLVSHLDAKVEEPASEPVADAPPPGSLEELRQRQSRLFPHTPRA
jgi:hypothetical protein